MDISQIKNDKLRMEAKLSAVENKLQKYEKYLPGIVELEVLADWADTCFLFL